MRRPLPPDRLTARYRDEPQLGEGGMATVYLTPDLKHDRRVAIKVLRPEIAAALATGGFLLPRRPVPGR